MTRDHLRWLLLGVAAVVLVVHSLQYNFVTDDAYISFVYSRNLAEHGQLAFNLGSPVEGYTNFLWTVVLGLLMLVGVPPEWSSRVLGTACALATLYVVFRMVERALGRKTWWAGVPPLLLACSSGFSCWTSGGLETQLFTLLFAVALDGIVAAEVADAAEGDEAPHSLAPMRRTGIALALAAMTRPEGLLVAAIFGAVRVGSNLAGKRVPLQKSDLRGAAWFAGIWAPWFAWRSWYYGHLFPNTYYVKADGKWLRPDMADKMFSNGLYYVWVWVKQTRLLFGLPFVALGLVAKLRTPRFVLAIAAGVLAFIYLAYTVSVGGDFMGLHRFIMPVFVSAAVLLVLGLEWAIAHVPQYRPHVAIGACVLVVVGFGLTQIGLTRENTRSCAGHWEGDKFYAGNCPNDRGIDTPAFLMTYTADRAAIGRAMRDCFQPDDFAILGGAGAQPYFGRMRGIDVYGLVSDRIAHEEPRSNPRAGHTKWGSDTLLASYDPTFVMSCYQIHPTPTPPGLPCNVEFWKQRGFEQVTVHVPELEERGTYYTFLAKTSRHFQCGP